MRTIRSIIQDSGSQKQLADRLGVTAPYISQIGAGIKPVGSTRTFAHFVATLGMTEGEALASLKQWFPELFDDEGGTDVAA